MESNRKDASGWLYERSELAGIQMWGTGALIDHDTVPEGLYCYDLYTAGGDQNNENDIFIAKNVADGEMIGAVLSAEPMPFQGKESLSMQGIRYFDEEPLHSLEDIVSAAQQMSEPQQNAGFQMQTM
ncbi:LPD28 domain-containing protein [Enterocloster bolteae]|uniref:LPD28 domain-containing protein n=1 Tax=Enterocloster bolteae TaxID=208479 RepID=UPI00210AC978|nr:LPD28 domain-containing protein [Enterocloster bolteae]MCQ5144503.1 hypothetical protein [Enterocloster bolteae]